MLRDQHSDRRALTQEINLVNLTILLSEEVPGPEREFLVYSSNVAQEWDSRRARNRSGHSLRAKRWKSSSTDEVCWRKTGMSAPIYESLDSIRDIEGAVSASFVPVMWQYCLVTKDDPGPSTETG